MRRTLWLVLAGTGLVAVLPVAIYRIASAETSVRISGTSARADCEQVAIGLTRTTLRYPLFGSLSGWSRGVPDLVGLSADLYIYQPTGESLRLLTTIKAPDEWNHTSKFAIRPRIKPDGTLLLILSGCPSARQNCSDAKYYRVSPDGHLTELPSWPDSTPEESRGLDRCAAAIDSRRSDFATYVKIGPRGGPWRPVLMLSNDRLVPIADGVQSPAR